MKIAIRFLLLLFMSSCHLLNISERSEILSDIEYEKGNLEMAKILIDKAISSNPSISRQHFKRGLINEEMEKFQEAIKDFNNAIRLDSLNYFAYSKKGEIYKELKNFEKAIACQNKSIFMHPTSSGYLSRADTYLEMSLYDEAIRDCKEAIEIDSTNALAYHNLAGILIEIAEYEQALKTYDKALSLATGESISEKQLKATIYGARGLCYFKIGKISEACNDWNAAFSLESSLTSISKLVEKYCK